MTTETKPIKKFLNFLTSFGGAIVAFISAIFIFNKIEDSNKTKKNEINGKIKETEKQIDKVDIKIKELESKEKPLQEKAENKEKEIIDLNKEIENKKIEFSKKEEEFGKKEEEINSTSTTDENIEYLNSIYKENS